jgi:ABC-type uncharacterized transport system substrate-binding protein
MKINLFSVMVVISLMIASHLFAQNVVLVIGPQGDNFVQTAEALNAEIKVSGYNTEYVAANDVRNETQLHRLLQAKQPIAVVLMDNPSINLWRSYIQQKKRNPIVLPSVSLMAVDIAHKIESIPFAGGVSYEIPAVTALAKFREVLKGDLKRVGVIYREPMEDFVRKNQEFCKTENIDLIPYRVGRSSSRYREELRTAIQKMGTEVDAIWLLNDNQLLQVKYIQSAWLPFTRQIKKPIIVGAEVLVNPEFDFGTFAVVPDHHALGVQAADLLLIMIELYHSTMGIWSEELQKGWMNYVEEPISVRTILNNQHTKNRFELDSARVRHVDLMLK